MQLHTSHIKRAGLLLFGVLLVFSSCLKKIEEADHLDTNIFDRDYTGGQWFNIVDYYQYSNELGQIRVKVVFDIPESNLPNLKSSYFNLAYRRGTTELWQYAVLELNNKGGFNGSFDFITNEEHLYCLTLGIYLPEEDAVINYFEECVQL